MKLAKGFSLAAWLIIIINLLMGFGAIGIFARMSPAIADIIKKNERSLKACENMLVALTRSIYGKTERLAAKKLFVESMEGAFKNISEKEEASTIEMIRQNYEKYFNDNDLNSLNLITERIQKLSDINRKAMQEADIEAQHLGKSGAWGIVFMATFSFITGLLFLKNLSIKLLKPLEEIVNVLNANQNGDFKRRCSGINLPSDVKGIFGLINKLLDRTITPNHDF